jgi:hypothetical protein
MMTRLEQIRERLRLRAGDKCAEAGGCDFETCCDWHAYAQGDGVTDIELLLAVAEAAQRSSAVSPHHSKSSATCEICHALEPLLAEGPGEGT